MTELHLKLEGATATLRMSGPTKRNALTPDLLENLVECCAQVAALPDLRVVVLRGDAGVFTAGADLMSFMAAFQKGSREAVADLGRQATEALLNLPQVTVAAIEGPCVGGGVVLAAACDLRWAAPGSWLSVPEMDVGLPLTWGALPRLVQLVGEARAVDLVLSRRRVELDEALRMGLVTAALAAPFEDHLAARLADLAALPQNALRTTKRQLRQIREGDFDPRTDAKALLDALADSETAARAQAYMQAHRMDGAAGDAKTPES